MVTHSGDDIHYSMRCTRAVDGPGTEVTPHEAKSAYLTTPDALNGRSSQEGADEEIFHIQADGFWGPEKGFHDVEQLRRVPRPN